MWKGETIYIYGDSEQMKDFLYVSDVFRMNILAASARCVNGAFNTASDRCISVNRLIVYGDAWSVVERTGRCAGYVLYYLADISKAHAEL